MFIANNSLEENGIALHMGKLIKFWNLSHYVQMPTLNICADKSSEARGLNPDLNLHLHPYLNLS